MSPKTGRPKIDNPKSNRITIRLDDSTYQKLMIYCNQNNIDRAEAIRIGLKKILGEK